MAPTTRVLIWLFPVAFLVHDLEELLLWGPWLERHREEILSRIPAFLAGRVRPILGKPTAEAAVPMALIFGLTVLAALLAAGWGRYGFFLLASGMFFMHGFMHLGQAILLRRYVPAVVTSVVVVIPYGAVVFPRLLREGVVGPAGLAVALMAGAALMVPFILVMHAMGDRVTNLGSRGPARPGGHSRNS
jgi:hypothetical protein